MYNSRAALLIFSKKYMKVKHIVIFIISTLILTACGQSYEEAKKQSKAEYEKKKKEDSLALKIGVLPTLDCLPLYVAKEQCLFDTAKADIRLKQFMSQIDCDAALKAGKTEGCITDIVRGQHMKAKGTALDYVGATNAYWQLISNRKARIRSIKQLNDKMIAMARFSATALLADYATDSVKLKPEEVFKVQINDVALRLQMLLNNEMDATMLTEPQATTARIYKNDVLMDSRDKDMRFGVIAFRTKALDDKRRKQQLQEFLKGYNAACDTINKYGIQHFASILEKYYKIDNRTLKALPKIKFEHATPPRQKDIDAADKWLKRQ